MADMNAPVPPRPAPQIAYRNTTSPGLHLVNSLARRFNATLELQDATGVSLLLCFQQSKLNTSQSKEF
jgi:two-component sensor histidine kinase